MNKVAKSAIAAAAGIVLLMGGAGSLAFWNDQANAGPASGSNTITAGSLKITAVDAGSWTKGFYKNDGTQVVAPAAVANLSSVKVVPGDKLVYTQKFNITASGDDLWFTVSNTPGTVSGATAAAADTALAAQLTSNFNASAPTVSGTNVTTSTTSGVYKVAAGATASQITVTWTLDFKFGATAVNTAQTGAVSLSQGAVTLTQVDAP